jgi:protein-S-isoprenylcysteine O-methyltransferase
MFAAFLLNNGRMYHIANSIALFEYLLVLYFRPPLKLFPYVSYTGKLNETLLGGPCYVCWFGAGIVVVFLGQFLRSAAMIKAASNFSHAVAFRKNVGHRLVTDGIYALVAFPHFFVTHLTRHVDGLDIHPMPDSFIGPWEHS